MRTRGVIGKRIVAIRQQTFFNESIGKMDIDVTAIVLENGWELRPFMSATENENVVDMLIHKPERKKPMQKKCPHTNYEELREGQGEYDPNSVTFICIDCGHTWGYEIELEPRDPD